VRSVARLQFRRTQRADHTSLRHLTSASIELVQLLQVRTHYAGARRDHWRRGFLVEINPPVRDMSKCIGRKKMTNPLEERSARLVLDHLVRRTLGPIRQVPTVVGCPLTSEEADSIDGIDDQ
jgi:hypothetical protein